MSLINFAQGNKENYKAQEMQDTIYLSDNSKEILFNDQSYGNATPADEEDITAEEGNLKLKDRAYDEASFSGKGYKILRKNIVEGKNILTQDMINEPNTIYEIRYDFDLNGTTINIPEGCTLEFQGGSFSNGTLNCDGKVFTDKTQKYFLNISFNITDTSTDTIFLGGSNMIVSVNASKVICLDDNFMWGFHYNNSAQDVEIDGRFHTFSYTDSHELQFPVNNSLILKNFRFYSELPSAFVDIQPDKENLLKKIIFQECFFQDCSLNSSISTSLVDCTFNNSPVWLGTSGPENSEDVYRKFTALVDSCTFYIGDKISNNTEALQIGYNGREGFSIIQNCKFYDSDNTQTLTSDWIDLYLSKNSKVVNNHFYVKREWSGEGIINIKAHTYDSSIGEDWTNGDLYDGNVYNGIISGNSFYIESGNFTSTYGVIWVRDHRRNQEDQIINKCSNTLISNNMLYIQNISSGTICLVFCQTEITNLSVQNNKIEHTGKGNAAVVIFRNETDLSIDGIRFIQICNNTCLNLSDDPGVCFDVRLFGDYIQNILIQAVLVQGNFCFPYSAPDTYDSNQVIYLNNIYYKQDGTMEQFKQWATIE